MSNDKLQPLTLNQLLDNIESQRTQPEPLIEAFAKADLMKARFQAGAHERCASCLNWIDKKKLWDVGMYLRHDGAGESVVYALCKRCGPRFSDPDVAARVRDYVGGRNGD